MATLGRSTKSGSDWTRNELRAYNITVAPQDVITFFGNPTLPQPSVHKVILDNKKYPPDGIADKADRNFFFYLEAAMSIPPGGESAFGDFVAHLLGFSDITFLMCGKYTTAMTDVYMISRRDTKILLVVQEDKQFLEGVDPEPQLIAQAIAAFQCNNLLLESNGKEPIRAKIIPGIVIFGTTPTFYKISVTQDLVDAVEGARYPANPTIVHKLIPPVEDLYGLDMDGMQPLNNRAVILGCFEAFKQFVD
ncbi:hypothetical protein EDB92DRAFT_1852742 [Lactarius akahatsu]|uniref:Uncharacterized protein n=1 Tax=Lactarius akahatsu TaxID=416441 RepID=A0AAD4LNJ0_9AGAM|nr:hypothetical protein EDB92DRAFT_1852742 [Lactarius akahatsu]